MQSAEAHDGVFGREFACLPAKHGIADCLQVNEKPAASHRRLFRTYGAFPEAHCFIDSGDVRIR